MKRHILQPQEPPRPATRIRLLTMLAASVSMLSLTTSGEVAADQPPKIRACRVAVVDKDQLAINCPKGRLGELLTALHEKTGMESDLSAELAATPVSVVLEKASLRAALDTMLASYNYSLDGAPVIVGGRANGTKVVVLGLRETAAQDKHTPTDVPTASTEPTPSRYQEEPPTVPETATSDGARPGPAESPVAEAHGLAPGMPAPDPEAAAKAREAFFANLPAPGAALPPAAAQVELPPSQPIQNTTGPGDGRRGMQLPDFTPGPPTRTPPGVNPHGIRQ